jgi:hypothetical protein
MSPEPLDKLPWWAKAIITAILSVLGTLYTINYTSNKTDKQAIVSRIEVVESRQQKLEAHQDGDHETLQHIQAQVDKLVAWALGK